MTGGWRRAGDRVAGTATMERRMCSRTLGSSCSCSWSCSWSRAQRSQASWASRPIELANVRRNLRDGDARRGSPRCTMAISSADRDLA